jgi:hypothetical protein
MDAQPRRAARTRAPQTDDLKFVTAAPQKIDNRVSWLVGRATKRNPPFRTLVFDGLESRFGEVSNPSYRMKDRFWRARSFFGPAAKGSFLGKPDIAARLAERRTLITGHSVRASRSVSFHQTRTQSNILALPAIKRLGRFCADHGEADAKMDTTESKGVPCASCAHCRGKFPSEVCFRFGRMNDYSWRNRVVPWAGPE